MSPTLTFDAHITRMEDILRKMRRNARRTERRLDQLEDNLPWTCPHHDGKLCSPRSCCGVRCMND